MYCPQCGTANDDAASFCTSCGNDLQKYREQWATSPANPADPAAGQQPAAPPAAYPPPYQQQYQPPYQTTPAYQAPPPYQPAPHQPAGYQPGYGYGAVPKIPSYMAWAIVTLILCFWPTGIVAVVYASKVGNRLALGDVPGAQEASRKAKLWCWITFGIGVVLAIIAIIGIAAAVTATRNLTVY
jgi:hypothetical protein